MAAGKKVLKLLTSFYVLASLVFLIWMVFFDENDLVNQWRLKSRIRELEREKLYYLEMISKLEQEKISLLQDEELLERFARERYLMKKPGEEVYIIEQNSE
jgi:cell division protein DivIC